MLTDEQLHSYGERGYVVVPGLLPADLAIDALVGIDHLLCAKAPGLKPSSRAAVVDEIHDKILELQQRDRPLLGKVYDAIRKVSGFWSMVGSESLVGAARQLMGTAEVGVVFRGCGIRLDLPEEDRWRSRWHQEYHSQMSSPSGVTAWFNLVPVTMDMGPVQLLEGSHREGIVPVRCLDPMNTGKNYTETFVIPNLESLVEKYRMVSSETRLGDVVFLHFLTLHQSGWNRSPRRSRVTCQVRYFDLLEPSAIANNWQGGWQDGGDFTKVHPDKVLP